MTGRLTPRPGTTARAGPRRTTAGTVTTVTTATAAGTMGRGTATTTAPDADAGASGRSANGRQRHVGHAREGAGPTGPAPSRARPQADGVVGRRVTAYRAKPLTSRPVRVDTRGRAPPAPDRHDPVRHRRDGRGRCAGGSAALPRRPAPGGGAGAAGGERRLRGPGRPAHRAELARRRAPAGVLPRHRRAA